MINWLAQVNVNIDTVEGISGLTGSAGGIIGLFLLIQWKVLPSLALGKWRTGLVIATLIIQISLAGTIVWDNVFREVREMRSSQTQNLEKRQKGKTKPQPIQQDRREYDR